MNNKAIEDLKTIFLSGVESVNPCTLIHRCMSIRSNNLLSINTADTSLTYDLHEYDKIYILGAGKATAKMAKALEEILKGRDFEGVISVKYGHTEPLKTIKTIEAGHPVPDNNSIRAAEKIKLYARNAGKKTLIINLISGGGSALLTSPLECVVDSQKISLTPDEIQETTKVLLASGATIQEMNCIRKHLSSIKGGRLAELMYPAAQVNLILSDVVGDRLDTIASGLTTHDETTYGDALAILNKYSIENRVPAPIAKILHAGARGLIAETPKKNDKIFTSVQNVLLGTNYTALAAASTTAKKLGYHTVILSSQITGEAREAAKFYAGIARDISRRDLFVKKPACIIGGGETTVTLRGSGKGGRNQELALSFLLELLHEPAENGKRITLLAASTDGNDGPTDAAGAFAFTAIPEDKVQLYQEAEDYLRNNDSYTFFEKAGFLLKTGPTNTNVCDLQIIIVK